MKKANHVTNYSLVLLVCMREEIAKARLKEDRVRDALLYSKSKWSKIMNGRQNFDMETYFQVCEYLGLTASNVMNTMEMACLLLNHHGWSVIHRMKSDQVFDDHLLVKYAEFRKLRDTAQSSGQFHVRRIDSSRVWYDHATPYFFHWLINGSK